MNAPYEVQCYISDQMEPDSSFLFCLKSKYHYNEESGREENGKFDRCVKKHLTFNGDLTRDEYQRLKQEPITTKKIFLGFLVLFLLVWITLTFVR